MISICIAVMMTWAIYPLTNLYNRSAIPEFFAVAFLTCSLASFLCVILNDGDKPVSRYDIIATGLFFVLRRCDPCIDSFIRRVVFIYFRGNSIDFL